MQDPAAAAVYYVRQIEVGLSNAFKVFLEEERNVRNGNI
jgi:hypothetical protein